MNSKQTEEMDKVIKFLALELPEPVWNDVNKKWQGFKSGYAAAPQKGGLPKLDEPLISQQDLEDYEKMEREEKSPSPSEAGDEISDADFEFMRDCDFHPTSIGAYLDKADLIKLSGILLKYANTLAS